MDGVRSLQVRIRYEILSISDGQVCERLSNEKKQNFVDAAILTQGTRRQRWVNEQNAEYTTGRIERFLE